MARRRSNSEYFSSSPSYFSLVPAEIFSHHIKQPLIVSPVKAENKYETIKLLFDQTNYSLLGTWDICFSRVRITESNYSFLGITNYFFTS